MKNKKDKTPQANAAGEQNNAVAILDVFAINKQELAKKVKSYENLVVTRDTLADCKAGLQVLRQLRYDIQNQKKANDKTRNEWNKKMMDSNELKAAELIEIISPVEDPLETKVKEIEAEIQAEKDAEKKKLTEKIDARVKLITDTGASIEGSPDGKGGSITVGYILNDQYISMDEIKELPDGTFNRVVKTFQDTAAAIAEESEKLRLAEAAKAERIRIRTAKLFEIGMVQVPTGFVLPFITDDVITENDINSLDDNKFEAIVEQIMNMVKAKAKADADAKAESDRISKEQAAAAYALANERAELDKQKKQMQDDMVESRRGQLIAIGFVPNDNSLVFDSLIVYPETMRNMTSVEWNSHVQGLTKDVNTIKADNEKKAQIEKCIQVLKNNGWASEDNSLFKKFGTGILLSNITADLSKFDDMLERADKTAQNVEDERIKNLMPDKEKLDLLLQDILKIKLPEVKTAEAKDILTAVNAGINIITDELSSELKKIS